MSRTAASTRWNGLRRTLDQLDERLVPSTVDLTTRGSEGWANDALFRQCDAQPTGTGVIRSFVRVHATGVEHGYNTDARPLQFDENKSPQFTRSLRLGDVPVVMVNGVAHREFLLDINQKGSGTASLLWLTEMRVYVGARGDLTGYKAADHTLAGMTPLYDLDGAGDASVKMEYRLNSGSGSGDVLALVPDRVFAGRPADGFLYLYSKFSGANAGFEEWAVRPAPKPTVPLSSLSGYVYFDGDSDGVREPGGNDWGVEEAGIANVPIRLEGVNDLGEAVTLTTTTDASGHYAFTGLRPGTYSLRQVVQPAGFYSGVNTVGSQGGQADPAADYFYGISLAAGVDGVENNFGELPIMQPG